MKIVHIHLMGPFTDGWGYQENILPIIQARNGHNVFLITNCFRHADDGSIVEVPPCEYTFEGVRVVRIKQKKLTPFKKINDQLFVFPVYKHLVRYNPDVIVLHGLGRGLLNQYIKKYLKKNIKCVLLGDVHAFQGNDGHKSKTNLIKKLCFWYQQKSRKILYKYYHRVFPISSQCYSYALEKYKVPSQKLALLPLGYDPKDVEWEKRDAIRHCFRAEHSISDNEIVIVHGGKIVPRRKTEMAIEACKNLGIKTKLIVFGAIDRGVSNRIHSLIDVNNSFVIYLGHLTRKDYLKVFLSSDIALFPGAQSSIWEEAIGCGLPLFLNYTEKADATYYDVGGNVLFSSDDTAESFTRLLLDAISKKTYLEMAKVASTTGRDFFSYERISMSMLKGVKNEN